MSKTYKKETLRFFRFGYFITNNHTDDQCTAVGWKGYSYKVTIEAKPKLDERGFLLDHAIIHKAITDHVAKKPMLSCELTVKTMCELVADIMIGADCHMYRLGFHVTPVNHQHLAPNEYGELVSTNPKTNHHDKHASAEYWIEF